MQDTERFKVYYAADAEILQKKVAGGRPSKSALVTGGALFGIKFIGRNAELVVALDAYAMQDRAGNGSKFGRTLGLRRAGSGGRRVGSHGGDSSMREQVSQILGIPSRRGGISFLWANACVYVRQGT